MAIFIQITDNFFVATPEGLIEKLHLFFLQLKGKTRKVTISKNKKTYRGYGLCVKDPEKFKKGLVDDDKPFRF